MRKIMLIILLFTASLAFGNIKLCGGDLPKALIRQNGFDLCSLYVRVGATIDTGLNINGTLYFYGVPFVPSGPDSFYFLPSTSTSAAGWVYCSDTVRIDTTTAIFPDTIYFAYVADSAGYADSSGYAAWPDSAQVLAWLGQLPAPDTVLFAWSCDTCDSARISAFADSARIAATAGVSDSALWPDSVQVASWVPTGTDTTFLKFRIDDTADTALQIRNSWGLVRDGNIMYGNADSTHVNLGVDCTTGTATKNRKYSVVSGGFGNRASSASNPGVSTIGGGYRNKTNSDYNAILGGMYNITDGNFSAILGGGYNSTSGVASAVFSGYYCKARGDFSFSFGGSRTVVDSNSAKGVYSGVFGGWHNAAGDAADDTLSSILQSYYSYATGRRGHVAYSDSSYVTANYNSICIACSNDTVSTDSTLLIGRYVKLINIKTPLRLLDSAQVWDDIRIAGASFVTGAGSPVFEDVIGNLKTYGLKGTAGIDEVSAGTQLSHQTKAGSTLRPHYHWRVKDAPSGAQDTVKVFIAYGIFQYDTLEAGHLDTMITYMVITTADTGKTKYSPIGDWTAPNTLSPMIPVTIWRDASDAEDTYGGTWYLWEFDIHYQKDALGSKQERVK